MVKEDALDIKNLVNAWLTDIWNNGGIPYITAVLKGDTPANAERNGRPFPLPAAPGDEDQITLNLAIDAIDKKGFSFDEVSQEEGWYILSFGCRFNKVPVRVNVPVTSMLHLRDRSSGHLALITPLGTNNGSFFVDSKDNLPEMKKAVESIVSRNSKMTESLTDDQKVVLGFPVKEWHQFYAAFAYLAYATAMAKIPFKFSAVTGGRFTHYLSTGEIAEAWLIHDSYGEMSVKINGDSYGNIAVIKPRERAVEFVKEDGVTDRHVAIEAIRSFIYGHDLTEVKFGSDELVYIQDQKLVKAVLNSLAGAIWPSIVTISMAQYKEILEKSRQAKFAELEPKAPEVKAPAQVVSMADFRRKN